MAAYLAEDEIVELAKRHDVDAIHPGYGLLSERASFARKCRDAGIVFVGPTPEAIDALGDKVAARKIARGGRRADRCPGRPSRCTTLEAARAFADQVGYPVMIKASAGGGGRGMRVVRSAGELARAARARALRGARRRSATTRSSSRSWSCGPSTSRCRCWATTTATWSTCSSATARCSGATRRSSSTRRPGRCPQELRARLADDALKIARQVNYTNAGTVEFLVGEDGSALLHRGQPAHPGRAHGDRGDHRARPGAGADPDRAGLQARPTRRSASPTRRTIEQRGVAIQVRVTAEDPRTTSCPTPARSRSTGRRWGSASGSTTARATSARASRRTTTRCWRRSPPAGSSGTTPAARWSASLREFRIRGVKTNLRVPRERAARTRRSPPARRTPRSSTRRPSWCSTRRAAIARRASCATSARRSSTATRRCAASRSRRSRCCRSSRAPPPVAQDAAAAGDQADPRSRGAGTGSSRCCAAIRACGCTDTTWRDAHQSLLATRVRTYDLARVAPATAHLCADLFSLEMWGGATFDVAYRFLSEDPWLRLEELRRLVPNVMFQMLVRGANAVGYTNYPDDVVVAFIEEAAAAGHGRVPDLRRAQRRRQHAGGDRGGAEDRARSSRRPSATPATSPIRRARSTTSSTTSTWPRRSSSAARTCCASRTWPACCSRARRRCWSRR